MQTSNLHNIVLEKVLVDANPEAEATHKAILEWTASVRRRVLPAPTTPVADAPKAAGTRSEMESHAELERQLQEAADTGDASAKPRLQESLVSCAAWAG